MGFAPTSSRHEALSRLDTTTLVGVLLAVLAIVMLAMPVPSRPVRLDLGGICGWDREAPESLRVRIDANGGVFVNDQRMPVSGLRSTFTAAVQAAVGNRNPSLQMDINGDADYQTVARVIAASRDAGLAGVGFVKC